LENEAVVLHSILGIYPISFYKEVVNDVRNLITRLVQNHGFNDGPARYKTIMNYTIELIEGRNPENPGWLATSDSHRIPSQLGINFIKLIADYMENTEVSLKPKYYQVILTTLNIVRMVEGLVDPDLQSITTKSKPIDQDLLDEFSDYVAESLENVKKIDDNINLFNVRFNLKKSGPNGVPKIESATQEAVALLNSVLARPFKIICQELNCEYLYSYLELLVNNVNSDLGNSTNQSEVRQTTNLRVLARIPDKGCKTRMVAIVDFWSQLILEPIRSYVQSVIELKFGKTDFRKDQDLGVARMVEFQQRCLDGDVITNNGKTIKLDPKDLYFYDISSWTDRFHRDLQKVVMRKLFSPRLAEAWGQLTVHCNWYYPKLDLTLKYGQGQGMGTNGSFDIATLTDHLFINYIIDKKTSISGIFPNNQCYGKVGDDLWIYDPERQIPKYYEMINLPINLSKSKEFVNGNSIAEFCARTFLNATDVSRISPGVISKSKDFRYIPLLLGICSSRGIQLDATSFESLSRMTKEDKVSYLDKLQDWLISYLLIAQYEPSSQWQSLDMDYLTAGNWVKGELITQFFQDPKLRCRLLIAYSIVTILENKEDIQDKLFDLVDAMDDYSDEIIDLCNPDTNLFDVSNPYYATALEACGGEILTPRQIIVFGRYVDQRIAIQDKIVDLTLELQFIKDPMDIYKYSKEISILAHKSCYDGGNINYNVDRVIGTQYKIVKVLKAMDEDYTILSGLSREQLRSLWQDLPYDELAEKWEGFMPTLST
jgi:hypothetical protein